MKRLILASSSPARKELLEQAGIAFKVIPSTFEEDMGQSLAPRELAIALSQGKAREVATRVKDAVVLGADSFAVFEGQLLGKPHTVERAKEMLTMLAGNCHTFITGFTIIDSGSGKELSDAVETKVYMKKLSLEEIERYIAKEDVLEKAGAYRSQNLGAALIKKVEGDYNNVRGLPLSTIATCLIEFGVTII